jgi:hypothetical protein
MSSNWHGGAIALVIMIDPPSHPDSKNSDNG